MKFKKYHPSKDSPNTMLLTDFGAKGDSISDSKPAFDKAMKACKKKKAVKLSFLPVSLLLTAPYLVDNTCIELKKGAKLVFGNSPAYYLPVVPKSWGRNIFIQLQPVDLRI